LIVGTICNPRPPTLEVGAVTEAEFLQKNPNFSCYIAPEFLQYFSENPNQRSPKKRKQKQDETKIISKILFSLALVFVLGSTIMQVRGEEDKFPVITIHSTGDVTRGKTGSFVLNMNPVVFGGMYVNFKVSGTAIPGVDYVALVSPAHIGQSGYGVILVQTLPDRRAPSIQSYSVVVTLEPGPGYAVGEPKSAQMMIKP
jgi:hypothetical protein